MSFNSRAVIWAFILMGEFILSLFIAQNEKVEMGVYDETGKMVKLPDPINGYNLASGIPFVKAMISQEMQVPKIEIVK